MLFDKEVAWKNGQIEVAQPKGAPSLSLPMSRCAASAPISSSAWRRRREPLTPGEDGVRVLEVLRGLPAVSFAERRAGQVQLAWRKIPVLCDR